MKLRAPVFLLPVIVAGCAIPPIQELRSTQPNEQFVVHAQLGCLFDKGVEHVSSYTGMSQPKFTWFVDRTARAAWFRQPLTLIELHASADDSTEVRRSQTPSAEYFGQGNELIGYLKTNPCR